MNVPRIGKFMKVPLREIWKHEALDFTNWLSEEENINLLADELGISIINAQTEIGVGKFSVDILAEDDNGNKLIIENQLEVTDHDHLGKIITYAAGLEAKTIIWIVARARQEHEQAVNWLNENTTKGANFFLIEIEAWKIDESSPAPRFNIVEKPNDWAKTVRESSAGTKLTDTKLAQQEFWEKLRLYGIENSKQVKSWQKALPQHWMNISFGTSKAHLSATINSRENYVGMELYTTNSQFFNNLQAHKEEINKLVSRKLKWMELPSKKSSRILLTKSGDFQNPNEQEKLIEWLHTQAELFTQVFKKYI